MAGRGPAAKTERSRPNDTARRQAEFRKAAPDGKIHGPELPATVWIEGEGAMPWADQTLAWWATWRSVPWASSFTPADWDFLLDTALLHNALWHGDTKVAAELRLRVAKLGATPEDRIRLRITIDEDEAAATTPAPPANISEERQARILQAVSDAS